MNRALIVTSSQDSADMLQQILSAEGYGIIAVARSGSEARRLVVSDTEPELVIINSPLSDEFGQELAVMITENTSAGIILICRNDIGDDIADKVSDSGVCVVPKPVNRQLLSRSVKLIKATRTRMMGLKKENADLLTKIDEMRLINRAKCTLMQYLKFTEPQAHKYIEKQAMNTRQTRREVAMRILATYER